MPSLQTPWGLNTWFSKNMSLNVAGRLTDHSDARMQVHNRRTQRNRFLNGSLGIVHGAKIGLGKTAGRKACTCASHLLQTLSIISQSGAEDGKQLHFEES